MYKSNYVILIILLTSSLLTNIPLAKSSSLFFDDFNGTSLSSSWMVEQHSSGGSYSVNNGVLLLSTSTTDPVGAITVYRPITPTGDSFTVSARVSSSKLAAFALRLHCGSPPIFGSTSGVQLEMASGVEGKWFVASWASPGWTWNNFYGPVNINTWYIIEMVVQKSPFKVTFNVYNSDGSLLGTYQTTNLGVTYSSIKYICLELWTGPATYNIDWIKIDTVGYVPNPPKTPPIVVIDEAQSSGSRVDLNSQQSVRFHASWSNETDVSDGLIYINGKGYQTNSGGWIVINDISSVITKKTWRVTAVNCSGVLDFDQEAASPSIIWDRVNMTLSVKDDRIDVGSKADVRWTAFYEYDSSPFQGKVNMKIISSQTSTPTPVGKNSYQVESIEDEKYGLTVFTSNQVDCIFDRVKITQGGVTNPLTKTGNMESVWFKAVYEYDNGEFTGDKGVLYVNNLPMVWSSFDKTWKYSIKIDDPGKLVFEVNKVEDKQYGLTKFIDAVGPQSITWEKPFLETPVGIASVFIVLATIATGAILYLRKRL